MAATATATLQASPITFRSPSLRTNHINPLNISFSSRLILPKLNFKSRRAATADSAAGRYAGALADLANSNKTLDATAIDVEKLDKLFSDPTVLNFFSSPIVTLDLKRELIDAITSSKFLQSHVCNFLNVLIESRRIDLIREIVKEFEVFYNGLTATEVAVVASVVPLDRQHLAQIAKQVRRLTGGTNVRIKTKIDESLVAGFTIRYGSSQSKMIDMSVKKQLEDIAALLQDVPIPV